MTDPIADFLTRTRNALALRRAEVRMPYSGLKHRLAELLESAGYVANVAKLDEGFGVLRFDLRYSEQGVPLLHHLRRISTPGRRVYHGYEKLRPVSSGRGVAVLSTSRGLMTDTQAKKEQIGGEVMCELW